VDNSNQSARLPCARSPPEYEGYWQDSWRWRPNLTINYGVRWSTSTPVYERNGFEVKPTRASAVLQPARRGRKSGVPFNELLTIDLAGKANHLPGFYKQDWNNFAPTISAAWSPDFWR
jgi:hypothetical protein